MRRIKIFFKYYRYKAVYPCLILGLLVIIFYIYMYTAFYIIPDEQITDNLVSFRIEQVGKLCPYNEDNDTEFQLLLSNVNNEDKVWASNLNISEGGEWHPFKCSARYSVAVVIPYRNRANHLKIFMYYIHHFLQKQNIHYKIFVIEQDEKRDFNRGLLFNIGFSEVIKEKRFPCFIFHDVDLLPVNLKNIYACSKYPRHMAVAIEKYGYKVPYDRYFGGVTSILTDQFLLVNGFSNKFYGWGGEDDDFFNRIRNSGLQVVRFGTRISKYNSLFHEEGKPSPDRYNKLYRGHETYHIDGLNSLEYSIKKKINANTHVRIVVEI
ncbi:hypothetical protein PGB90_010185 [Kerria lacca]